MSELGGAQISLPREKGEGKSPAISPGTEMQKNPNGEGSGQARREAEREQELSEKVAAQIIIRHGTGLL